jgi:RNA polymerase sigma-70 factor, ECF subfamily
MRTMLRRSPVPHHTPSVSPERPVESGKAGKAGKPGERPLEQLYEDHIVAIYHFIYARVGNREEAEDLTSQVFLKALHGLDGARNPRSMQAWLFQVARTTIADHWRAFYRVHADSLERLCDGDWDVCTSSQPVEPTSHYDKRVQHILGCLPARYREVLTCRFLLNYTVRETAKQMGITETNVKVLQFRALKKAAEYDHAG